MQPDPIYAFLKFYVRPSLLLHGISTWRLFSFSTGATIHPLSTSLFCSRAHLFGAAAWTADTFDSWYHICLCAPEYLFVFRAFDLIRAILM